MMEKKQTGLNEPAKLMVEEITGQTELADIARNDKDADRRKAAVEKLTDQSVLAEVVKNAYYYDVRKLAIEKLTDPSVLADIAKNASRYDEREAAVEKLTDQAVLEDIAKNGKEPDISKLAVKKLTDQQALTDIARSGSDVNVRYAAIEKITDEALRTNLIAALGLAPLAPKERHGCVTTWLVLMILGNGIVSLYYFFSLEDIANSLRVSPSLILFYGVIGLAGVIFAILLLNWKKSGFWGIFLGVAFMAVISGEWLQALFGLVSIFVLFGILQIKKNGISTWEQLE